MNANTVEYDKNEDILIVKLHGTFDAKILSESTSEMVKEQKRTKCTRILMDHTDATPLLSVADQYDRPATALKLGVPSHCRISILYHDNKPVYDFIETVGRNKGFIVKTFMDKEEALKWLHQHR